MWSDESPFMLSLISGQVYVCTIPKKAYNCEWLVPTVKHEGRSKMILAATSWYSATPIIALNNQITVSD
jgi:hypothetical protein